MALNRVPPISSATKTAMAKALALHQSAQVKAAIAQYRQILALSPNLANAHELLGVALSQIGQHEEAIASLRTALRLSGGLESGQINLGRALLNAGKPREAALEFRALYERSPGNESACIGLAQSLVASGKLDEAMRLLEAAMDRFPKSSTFFNERGKIASAIGKHIVAEANYRRALTLNPKNITAAINLGSALAELRKFSEAERILRAAVAAAPKNMLAIINLAHILRRQLRAEEALAQAQLALSLSPKDPATLTLIGQCLTDLGRIEEAESAYRQVIEGGVDIALALAGLAQIHKFKGDEPEIKLVDSLISSASNLPYTKKSLLHAKAKMLDDCGQYDRAIDAALEAKRILPSAISIDRHAAYLREVMRHLDANYFMSRRKDGHATDQPVFVLGMPRSGTTLVEQIIASHDLADGAGELTALHDARLSLGLGEAEPGAFLARLDKLEASDKQQMANSYLSTLRRGRKSDAVRITDKLPHNFQNIWLIALLFPDARIIHCRRQPVDTCMSIFLRNFSDDHWYTRDLETLGKFYRLYEEQVAHWKSVCGLKWYDNDYEQLVADPEPNIRRMIEFLDLPWDEKCLSHTETERSVMTFSRWQVRQPIYKSSVEKWRRYAPYIGPLLVELGIPAS